MTELYRVFHYSNGFQFRLEGVASLSTDQRGSVTAALTSGEIVVIPTGWIATSFRSVPPVPQPTPQDLLKKQENENREKRDEVLATFKICKEFDQEQITSDYDDFPF